MSWTVLPFPRACFQHTLTFRTPQENHIVSVPFETMKKYFFVSPGHLRTIQNLIPGWTTIVKLLKQLKNWQCPSRDPWSNCLINSREDDKGQSYYYSGRQKDNSKTICGRAGYPDSSAACSSKNRPASACVFGTNAVCTLSYRRGGSDLSHT